MSAVVMTQVVIPGLLSFDKTLFSIYYWEFYNGMELYLSPAWLFDY